MSFYIKLLGLALMLIAAISTIKGYREYVLRRISELESFISLLSFMRGKINRYLLPIPDIIKEFSDENLKRVGFLDAVSSGKGVDRAFEGASGRLSVGSKAKKILREAFEELGCGYKDEVLANVDDASENLEKILAEEKETLPKDIKVFGAVLCSAVMGVFIILA